MFADAARIGACLPCKPCMDSKFIYSESKGRFLQIASVLELPSSCFMVYAGSIHNILSFCVMCRSVVWLRNFLSLVAFRL